MRIIKILKNPARLLFLLGIKGYIRFGSDEWYLRKMFRSALGEKLNLDDPKTFNEKLQWLKINDHNPDYIRMVDKLEAKTYVEQKLGGECLTPTLAVWEKVEDISLSDLPQKFVLKCTHDSGGIVICSDKSKFDLNKAKQKLSKSFKTSYFWAGREWPYKKIKPRVFAEQYIEDFGKAELVDYKIFCFHGVPRIILVCSNRFGNGGLKEDFFDVDWKHLNIARAIHSNSDNAIERPASLDEMLKMATVLSDNLVFSRMDFYESGGQVLFGEITLYPASGLEGFKPKEWDVTFGNMLDLDRLSEE